MHLLPNVLLKVQEEIWTLINREWIRYLDPGGCIRPHDSINRCRNLQDWWFHFQERRWLVRTFGLHQNMVQAIRSKRKTYLKVLPYRRRGFIDFDQSFIQGSNKICQFLPHTLWPRMRPTRLLESLPLTADMAENDEVVGGGAQLFDKLTR